MKKIFLLSLSLIILSVSLLAQGSWTQKADLPGCARYGAVGFSIGGKGYIGTGACKAPIGFPADLWEFDSLSNTWTYKMHLQAPGNRLYAVGFSIGKNGYIGTGTNSGGWILRDFFEWDQGSNTSGPATVCAGTARYRAVSFSIGTMAYLATGTDTFGVAHDDLWEWDKQANTWSQKANFPGTGRAGAIGMTVNNKGYLGLGVNGINYYNDFWEYDPVSNTWAQKSSLPATPRWLAACFAVGNKAYVGTGYFASNPNFACTAEFWEWDQLTDTWTQKADFAGGARGDAVGFSIGSKGYIGTGATGAGSFKNDFWEFDPNGNAVEENEFERSISISPNPLCEFAMLKIQDGNGNYDFVLFDVYGNKLREETIKNRFTLRRESLSSGIYFIRIRFGNNTAVKKLIVV